VLADHRHLKRVLVNLLSNALEVNRPGGRVTLECTANQAAGSPMVRFSVRDTGPGISAEKFTRLFTPFDRFEDVQPKTPASDRGLKLALSRFLIETMGGSMGAESVVDEGSTFWVEVALAHSGTTNAQIVAHPVQRPETGSLASGTILYIEGDPSGLRLITRILARRPEISLHSVKTVSAALEMPTEVRPNLILLDLPFAQSGGRQMLERLAADPRTAEIPVVTLCADPSPQGKALLLRAGARACLTKPVPVRTLLRAIDEFTVGRPQVESPD
jgi:CheY-like chemotaxis protein